MAKTVKGLIDFCKSKIGTPYVYGAKGQLMTAEAINNLRDIYGSNAVWWSDSNKAGQVCVDCSGLISWYTGIIRGSWQYKSTAKEVLPISKRTNEHIGWAVWMNGHIGIYLGDDKYIAADGSAYGVRIANLSQNRFTHLLKLCDIDYGKGVVEVEAVDKPEHTGGYYNAQIHFKYRARVGGKWLPEVTNLEDYAGIRGKTITDIAIGVDIGKVWYQVHEKGGDWLPKVTGYNIKDAINGFAGDGSPIDAIRVYYETPEDYAAQHGYQKAQYRVSLVRGAYLPWQFDTETTKGQDGYAGAIGKAIERFQIW